MLFPGISGSMVLLVLGYYYLYKSYVSNVTSLEPKVLIPIMFIALGVILGIVLSAKITNFLLKKYNQQIISFIIGLILMSGICIIPTTGYTPYILISSIISFIIGSIFITLFNKLSK
jgi:putative membrane protein